MDSSLYKDTTVSRGFTYHYFHSPAAPGQLTLLFIHGFPSTSHDWRRQVAYFRPKGYGVLVPDIIGAGGTSKPEARQSRTVRTHSASRSSRVTSSTFSTPKGNTFLVNARMRRGSVVLSRLANLYSERFHAFAWLALSYVPPTWRTSGLANADAKNTQFGYWEYLSRDTAYVMCEQNLDSFLHLTYPATPDHWYESLSPPGKTQAWIESDRRPGLPEWLSQEEYDVARETLAKAGLKSALNYYKAMVNGVNTQDDESVPEEAHKIQKPALFIASARDSVCTAAGGKTVMAQYAPHATIIELNVGHWPHLEETGRVNLELDKWLDTLNLREL